VQGALNGAPHLSSSRLLCPRLLQPDTDYLACVVPTFEVGRKAGLGDTITEGEVSGPLGLAPAWRSDATAVTLPVYAHWQFRTGSGGDFASLVRLLRIQPAPAGLGTRPIDVGQPGFRLPADFPSELRLLLEGALQPMRSDPPPPGWSSAQADTFRTALADIVNRSGNEQAVDQQTDPLLAPPLYGRWHAARQTAVADGATWFDELNLDPRWRSVAAFGTRVIQEHQEALMAAAWEQAADLQPANQRLRQLQLSLVVNTSFVTRQFSRLNDEATLRIAAPLYGRIQMADADAPEPRSLFAAMKASPVPVRATSPPMRRIGRERGPISRRMAAQGAPRLGGLTWVGRLNEGGGAFVLPPPYLLATVSTVRERMSPPPFMFNYAEVTESLMGNALGRPYFQVMPEGEPIQVLPPPLGSLDPDNASAAAFRAAAREHLARLDPGRTGQLEGPPPPVAMSALRAAIMDQVQPRETLQALARAVVSSGPNATSPVDTTDANGVGIETIAAAPHFPQPMYESLRDLSQSLLLPGLEAVNPNRVVGLQTNRRFVDAYMVGLNTEMARELLWRGYPTDQRGTCFDQFWDARTGRGARPDVEPLHEWGARHLGDAPPTSTREQFVLLLRSDLLRRYPTAVIYATLAVQTSTGRGPSSDPKDEVQPVFRGALPPDVSFFGFDLDVEMAVGNEQSLGYYVIIQEQPTEPSFGLPVGAAPAGVTHLSVEGPPPTGVVLDSLEWGRNGAHVAGILRRKPVRIAMHASQLIQRG
jgi:hypothetical protein